MNDVVEIFRSFGRGFIKLLIALAIGAGVALCVLGGHALAEPHAWQRTYSSGNYTYTSTEPPLGILLLGIGAGLLAFTIMMMLLFLRRGRRRDHRLDVPPPRTPYREE